MSSFFTNTRPLLSVCPVKSASGRSVVILCTHCQVTPHLYTACLFFPTEMWCLRAKIAPSACGEVCLPWFLQARWLISLLDGECSQTIVHPAISVWTVSTMPNGDIVSGCSDHVVRVFSASEDRWASEGDLKVYDEKVASQALSSQQVGDVKKSDLPGPEALTAPGTSSFVTSGSSYRCLFRKEVR